MTLLFILFGVFSALGLSIWLPPLWNNRRVLACIVIPGLSVCVGSIFGLYPHLWSALLVILTIYQMINLLRLVEGRTQARYLYRVSRNTALWLIGAQILVAGAAFLIHTTALSAEILSILFGVILVALTIFLYTGLRRSLRTTTLPSKIPSLADRDLPTLTVCIPARNETEDLEACLETLVTSAYSKLEIIVLDDCSQNKRTPEIIRSFAQKGVRFISGTAPNDNWLAKNHAYQQLAEVANGDVLLFCGIDARFQPHTLTAMVETLLYKDKDVVSFLPVNRAPSTWELENLMVQPSRYAWELVPPRRWLNRPPILSTCWLIRSETFKKAGTFKAVSRSIAPESYFAKYAAAHTDGYSFLVANKQLGFLSAKAFANQRHTAVRTRYPQVHRRPELVAFLSIGEFTVLVLPFVLLIAAIVQSSLGLAALFALTCVLLIFTYSQIVTLTYRHFVGRSLWLLPFAALYDIALLNYSMWQYEFREVIWKGRNVCIPAMRITPPKSK